MSRSDDRGAGLLPGQVRVRCCGRMHTVALNAKGQLVHRDHSRVDLRRRRDYECLGGERCRCTQVIRSFASAISEGQEYLAALPKPLRQAASELRRLRSLERPSWALRREEDLSCSNWWERPEGVQRLLARALHGPLGVPAGVRPVVGWCPYSYSRYELGLFPYALPPLFPWVMRAWLDAVYRPGLAVLGGALTVAILDPSRRDLAFPRRGAVAVQVWPWVAGNGAVTFMERMMRLRPRRDGGGFEGVPVRQRRRRG
jgi:hypothetical protein